MIELKNCNDIRKFNFNVFYLEVRTYSLVGTVFIKSPSLTLMVFSPHAWLCGKTKLSKQTFAITIKGKHYPTLTQSVMDPKSQYVKSTHYPGPLIFYLMLK